MTGQSLDTICSVVMETKPDKINRKLNEFINKMIFLGKKNIFEFKGLKLHPSEIHLILIMNETPTNATQMAQRLNVTKGAVSQTIARLVKKGILIKEKDPYLKNELTLMFTPFGWEVFEQYRQISRGIEKKFKEKISRFREDELDVVDRFLDEILQLPDEIKKMHTRR